MARPIRTIPPLKKQDILRFWDKVRIRGPDDCWPWQGSKSRGGYGAFHLGKGEDGKTHNHSPFRAPRIAWALAYGPIPEGFWVCHRCDNPPCCNPRHLLTAPPEENWCDRIRKGRSATGETHSSRTHPECVLLGEGKIQAKLTDQLVRAIRKRYATGGITKRVLAHEYGVATSTIGNVLSRKNWTHVV